MRYRALHLAKALRDGEDAGGGSLGRGGPLAASRTHGLDAGRLPAAFLLDVEASRRIPQIGLDLAFIIM